MLITLRDPSDAARVASTLAALGVWAEPLGEPGRIRALLARSDSAAVSPARVEAIDGVAAVWSAPSGHPLLDGKIGGSVEVAGVAIGIARAPVLIAGPCSVESPEQIARAAELVRRAGARLLRGGAFKPRASPYSFAGHGVAALDWLRQAADRAGLGVVTEVLSERDVDAVAERSDLLQIGSRSMHAVGLLRAVGRARKPVLLKRGMAATVEEWLLAAEHLLCAGANGVIFCERGLRGFDRSTRNLLDLGAVALVSMVMRLPVLVDPSHAAGRRDLIGPLSRAALAAGAHGLVIECHPDPGCAKSDAPQALDEEALVEVARSCSIIREQVEKT